MLNPITTIQQLYQLSPNHHEVRIDSQLIEQAEATLNIHLPAILYHYYQQLGNLNKSADSCHHIAILPLEKLGEYVVFAKSSQDDAIWGIHQDDLNQHNPMVAISRNFNLMDIDDIHWINELPLSEFLLAQAIYNGVNGDFAYHGSVYDWEGNTELNDKFSIIVDNLHEINSLKQPHERYFLTNNNLVVILVNFAEDGNITAIFIGSQDNHKLQQVNELLDIQWDYCLFV